MMTRITYAPRIERLFANLIDSIIMMLPAAILISMGGAESPLASVGSFACNLVYYIVFTASRWQATPGKRLLNMHVRRLDGRPLTERDAAERFLGYIIPTLPLYMSIAPENVLGMATIWLSLAWYMPILLREDRRGVHDVLCHTVVVTGRL